MCSAEFQTVPLCLHIQSFSFCSVPLGPVVFHHIAAIFAATSPRCIRMAPKSIALNIPRTAYGKGRDHVGGASRINHQQWDDHKDPLTCRISEHPSSVLDLYNRGIIEAITAANRACSSKSGL
jgi:hypothetical protein